MVDQVLELLPELNALALRRTKAQALTGLDEAGVGDKVRIERAWSYDPKPVEAVVVRIGSKYLYTAYDGRYEIRTGRGGLNQQARAWLGTHYDAELKRRELLANARNLWRAHGEGELLSLPEVQILSSVLQAML